MSDQWSRRLTQAVLGYTVTYTLYPAIGAGVVAGTTVTTGAGAWGADKELIAAAAITTEFFICGCDVDTLAAAQPNVIDLEQAGATEIFAFRCDPTAATVNLSRFMCGQFPVRITAGVQITARGSGTAAKTINVSTVVATGL
jgi:hypothetical protein